MNEQEKPRRRTQSEDEQQISMEGSAVLHEQDAIEEISENDSKQGKPHGKTPGNQHVNSEGEADTSSRLAS